jgi:hypothetical protein
MRRSVPFSSICVAKLCRRVCTVACLLRPVTDANEHALGVDVSDPQRDYLGDSEARTVGRHQSSSVANGANVAEELLDFRLAEHHRKLLRNTAPWQHILRPRCLQCHVVKEFGSSYKRVYRLA